MTKLKKIYFILTVILSSIMVAQGQSVLPENDECLGAIDLGLVKAFCSGAGKYTNVESTVSTNTTVTCNSLNTTDGDVWFTFKLDKLGVNIRVYGRGENIANTIQSPTVSLYRGRCNALQLLGCNTSQGSFAELVVSDLLPGETLTARISGKNGSKGRFELCIDGVSPVKLAESDCQNSQILCNKDPFVVPVLVGGGLNRDEVDNSCLDVYNRRPGETDSENGGSVWYKWKCKTAGTLTFTLTPFRDNQDLDFAVVRLVNGVDDCSRKELLRCMASGDSQGNSVAQNAPCNGPTGLSDKSRDIVEDAGCFPGDDNFLAPIDMKVGEVYALVVNNYTNDGRGFSISFGGTGTFEGPEFDFAVEDISRVECDKQAKFNSRITAGIDSIIRYQWSFGDDASKTTATGAGPHDVEYARWGNKVAALTVETLKGCITTKLIDLFVKPCCKDTTTLDAALGAVDSPRCVGDTDGKASVVGINGAGDYQYSIDGTKYTFKPTFTQLSPGQYQLYVSDQKGCLDSVIAIVPNADPINVTVGEDINVDLGGPISLNPTLDPQSAQFEWSIRSEGCLISQFDSSRLNQTFVPFGDTEVILTGINAKGCTDSDTLYITTNKNYSVITPNIINTESTDANDVFFIQVGQGLEKSIKSIKSLRIFDRWGNQVHYTEEVAINDRLNGWLGDFAIGSGQKVLEGVYIWVAEIEYIDCETKIVKGDITVLR